MKAKHYVSRQARFCLGPVAGLVCKEHGVANRISVSGDETLQANYVLDEVVPAKRLGTMVLKMKPLPVMNGVKSCCLVLQLYCTQGSIVSDQDIDVFCSVC
jgi:hypothetical protein